MTSRLLSTLAGVALSIHAFAYPPLSVAVKSSDYSCSASTLGITQDPGKPGAKVFPLCVLDVKCTATRDTKDLVKDAWYTQAVVCKSLAGVCPGMLDCVKQSSTDGRDFDWQAIDAISSSATYQNGDTQSCSYGGDPKKAGVILRELPQKDGSVALDGVCATRVHCNPKEQTPIAVCLPKSIGNAPSDFVCPQALDCVKAQFGFQKAKEKVEFAARPHGGTPAQTVSNSNGSTHSGGGQNR